MPEFDALHFCACQERHGITVGQFDLIEVDSDDTAVVDPECKVRGIDGLRVVDAAVMPDLVGANINATVIMIAEKMADIIRGRPTLAPVNV